MSPSPQVSIRRATRQDAAKIIASIDCICAEGNAFYVTRFVPSAQWDAVLSRPETVPDHLLLLAEWYGQLVGASNLFPGNEHTVFRHVAELGLWVLQPFRQHGIGAQLLGAMIDWAAQTGLEKITLSAFASNEKAISLYHRFGFTVEGVRHRQFKTGDTYDDELLMARFLSLAVVNTAVDCAIAK